MMKRKIYGIIVAGGKGVRMGSEVPKQFLELGGVPILARTLSVFEQACPEMETVVVLPEDSFCEWKDLCMKHSLDFRQRLVAGGISRFHSVRNALKTVPDGAVVMIHDGVRPLITAGKILEMLGMIESGCRAVIPVLPVTDTLKSLTRDGDGNIIDTGDPSPDRSRIFCAQTPQIFLSEDIKSAYGLGYDISFTDDASVAARKKIPLTYVEGERLNVKITTKDDLKLAEAILSYGSSSF